MKYMLLLTTLLFGSLHCSESAKTIEGENNCAEKTSLSVLTAMQKRWNESESGLYDASRDAMFSLLQKKINQQLLSNETSAIEKWAYFLKPENQGIHKRCIEGFYTAYAKKKHFFSSNATIVKSGDTINFSNLPESLSVKCIDRLAQSECCIVSSDQSYLVVLADRVVTVYNTLGEAVYAVSLEFGIENSSTDTYELIVSLDNTTIGVAMPEHNVLFVLSIKDMLDRLLIAKIIGKESLPCSKIQSYAFFEEKFRKDRLSGQDKGRFAIAGKSLMHAITATTDSIRIVRLDCSHMFVIITAKKIYLYNIRKNNFIAEYDRTNCNAVIWVEIDQKHNTIAIATADGLKKIWNRRTGKLQGVFLVEQSFFYDYYGRLSN